ncbi:MAG TPA: lipid-binding SYLF domain-containing protein, partial [Candidatus Aminicenantes bacterium]|nr:lipid-binding SYLF domain-containing protein [Candidatus Aminicenantes bacterium]
MKSRQTFFLLILALAVLPAAARRPASDEKGSAAGAERIEAAILAIQEMTGLAGAEDRLPKSLLHKARGIAIYPGVIKAAYGVGGQYGKGIFMVKGENGEWSNPAFVSLIGGSIGWQIGVQKADIILLFKTAKSVEDISKGKITMGADISVSAGPIGRHAEADTDLEMKAEIYSYSKSKGLFAGVSLKGASIQIDKDANNAFYGPGDVKASDILDGKKTADIPLLDKLK